MKILLFVALAMAGVAVAGVVAQPGSSRSAAVRITEREYRITLPPLDLHAGAMRFEIRNTGKLRHDFAIAGNGVKARTPVIRPGRTAVLNVTLKQGSYMVWCPLPGHAAKGMKATLIVGATAEGGGIATTANGDTGTGPPGG